MNNNERRNRIYEILESSDACINASDLAERFSVTRQVIVSDIALLRANGKKISAMRNGYFLEREKPTGCTETLICRHSLDMTEQELCAVVDNGGTVLSVTVEHPIYGQISGELNIASRYDVEKFMQKVKENNAAQLCDLTGGLHIHIIRVPDSAAYERIKNKLLKLGILDSDNRLTK